MPRERNVFTKLQPSDVREIRRRYYAGETRQQLADVFGVGPYTIRDIIQGRTWSWFEPENLKDEAFS
jgi:hypothetical protein